MADKICMCDHLEKEHRYMDQTPKQMLQTYVAMGKFEPQYDIDRIDPIGYIIPPAHVFWLHDDAMKEFERLQINYSVCTKKSFFHKTCTCRFFKADNLKYLESLVEKSGYQI